MKLYSIFILLTILVVLSCNSKQKNNSKEYTTSQDSLPPLQVTVLADLPDSLQPKTVYLDKMPALKVVAVPKNAGVTKMLPILRDEKGEPVLDPDGKPIFMADGGKSNFKNFTTDNGLAFNEITSSILDKNGNLWFATANGGVSKYDGKTFTNFTTAQGLANNLVLAIKEDKAGNLWFATQEEGVSKYDGRSFTNFTITDGLASNMVVTIVEDKIGNLWFGTNKGVSKYDFSASLKAGKPSFTNFSIEQGLAGKNVWNIIEDKTGNLWFGTFGGGVSKYDPSASNNKDKPSFTNFTTAQGLVDNFVSGITEDKSGNLWFGSFNGGVSKYDPSASLKYGKPIFTNFTTAHGLVSNKVFTITEDKAGNLWFATSGGVTRYDPSASLKEGKPSFINFTTAQGLVKNEVTSITEDKAGNLWFGTFGDGVSKYDGPAFINFSTAQGLADNLIISITEDKTGNLWFGSIKGGVSKYDPSASLKAGQPSFTNFTTAQGLISNRVLSITVDKIGNLWFGTDGGVSKYDGKSFTHFTADQGLKGKYVTSITEDKTGNLWIGTSDGVSKYDPSASLRTGHPSFTNFTPAQGLINKYTYCITEDKTGNIWIGTDGGVSKYDGKSFINFTTAQGLADNFVKSITEDKIGNLWFSTGEGLSVMRADVVRDLAANASAGRHDKAGHTGSELIKRTSSKLFRNFKIEDGLPDNAVNQVIQMPNGKMAVGTDLGITLFNISEDYSTLTDLEKFDAKTDYPVKNLNGWSKSVYLDSKGIIWAGTRSESRGLVRFDYAAMRRTSVPPTVEIQSIKVKDESICWYNLQTKGERKTKQDSATALLQEYLAYGKSMSAAENDSILKRFGNIQFDGITKFNPLPENLKLPYEHNQISFEYVAIETDRSFLVKYQYMLEGLDKNWRPVTGKSNVDYNNLDEGNYTFKLKAKGSNGVWAEPITYAFKVLPPWYRTWWAYGLYVILFVSGIFLFIRSRTKALQKEKILLEEKVTTRTSELNQSLENLKSTQSQLIQSEKMASLGELTAGIAHEIQNPLNFVNNFSEVNSELIDEMQQELKAGKIDEAILISNDIRENEQKINHHGKRAGDIVKGMLQHSRSSSGIKEPTDINALADEYLRLAYHGLRAKDKSFNATMKTDFDKSMGTINIIPQDIGRVILNLITNAFYTVNEKQKAESLKRKADAEKYEPTVSVSTKKTGDKVLISVRDNGSGIPQKILDKIFQPFFTTKPTGQGTGLGLSLSYDIVKAHGGEIKVTTREKEGLSAEASAQAGTAFTIQLPIS